MFVRRIKNPNGKTYVQVVDKHGGKYKIVKNIGNSSNKYEIENLLRQAKDRINQQLGLQEIDFTNYKAPIDQVFSLITEHKLVGLDLVLGKIFDQIEKMKYFVS